MQSDHSLLAGRTGCSVPVRRDVYKRQGTVVTTVMGVEKGAAFVRVHDVKENLRAIRMTQAILRECKV